MMPPFSPVSPSTLVAVLLGELLFGIGYNFLIAWGQARKLWPVSFSVIVGVGATLAIPAAAFGLWPETALLVACFAASGTPMTIFSILRQVKASHKRRAWPTAANRAREDAIMELSHLAHEISDQARTGTLCAGHLPDFVNRIHMVIGTLKSV